MKLTLFLIPILGFFLTACDTSQFDPSAHRERYEKERLNSNVKRFALTEDGRLPEAETPK